MEGELAVKHLRRVGCSGGSPALSKLVALLTRKAWTDARAPCSGSIALSRDLGTPPALQRHLALHVGQRGARSAALAQAFLNPPPDELEQSQIPGFPQAAGLLGESVAKSKLRTSGLSNVNCHSLNYPRKNSINLTHPWPNRDPELSGVSKAFFCAGDWRYGRHPAALPRRGVVCAALGGRDPRQGSRNISSKKCIKEGSI